jgi:hypothetical protein
MAIAILFMLIGIVLGIVTLPLRCCEGYIHDNNVSFAFGPH